MRNEKKTEIKVGITVLAGIVLFIFVYGWAKNYSVSSDYNFIFYLSDGTLKINLIIFVCV